MRRLSISLLLVLILSGCAGMSTPAEPSAEPPAPSAGDSAAVGLVGLWRVSEAEGETPETWLRLDAGDLMLWRECGPLMGSWSASSTAFLADIYGANGSCVSDNTLPTVDWLTATSGFAATDEGWQLLDASGSTTAVLTVDGAPGPNPDVIDTLREAPEVTDATRAALRTPAPLPADLEPASRDELLGRWVPAGQSFSTSPYVELSNDGSYEGNDGCNGGSGRWTVGANGEYLATSGISTLMACEGANIPFWAGQARSAGFDGEQLVLLDLDGAELGRLTRD